MNRIKYRVAIGMGRLVTALLKRLGRQASTLPGKIALKIDPQALGKISQGKDVLLVTGTNGKTTTTQILTRLMEAAYPKKPTIWSNEFGANLGSGMMTASLYSKPGDILILECDEAAFAQYSGQIQPKALLITNIFRDQLDRFGELDTVQRLLTKGAVDAGENCKVILCADDPNVAGIAAGLKSDVYFFGANTDEFDGTELSKNMADYAHCPRCGHTLSYKGRSMSHLGDYRCTSCDYHRPDLDLTFKRIQGPDSLQIQLSAKDLAKSYTHLLPLEGLYNAYNTTAAVLTASAVVDNLKSSQVQKGLEKVKPSFGRLERIPYKGREVCFVLVKNPAGMEQGLRLLSEAKDVGSVIFFLNNRINDGVDVSWIWDSPMEEFLMPDVPIGASGERAGDMALRLNYAYGPDCHVDVREDETSLVMDFLESCPEGKTVYLLPNYSAMMELRQKLSIQLNYDKIISKEGAK